MRKDEYINLILKVVPRIPRRLSIVQFTAPTVILLWDGFSQVGVEELEQGSCIMRGLVKNIDEKEFVEDTAGECKPPEGGMRAEKRSVRHHSHPEGDPEEHGHGESPFPVVHRVLDRGFYEGGVNQAADEDNKHGACVRPPEIGRLGRIFHRAFFLLLQTYSLIKFMFSIRNYLHDHDLPIVRSFEFAHVVRFLLLEFDLPLDAVECRVHGVKRRVHSL